MSADHSHWNAHLKASDGPNILNDAYKGKVEAVEKVSLSLLAELARREEMTNRGKTHVVSRGVAIPDSYVNRLACFMLQACQQSPPRSLCALIRVQLKARFLEEWETNADRYDLAACLVAENRNISNREVARLVGVDHTTIRRWRTEPDFQRRVTSDRDDHLLIAALDFFLPHRKKIPRS